jgi:hypothetical protein
LREEYRTQDFESDVLRKIFGPKKGELGDLAFYVHNEELQSLFWSLNIIRRVKCKKFPWARIVVRMRRQ